MDAPTEGHGYRVVTMQVIKSYNYLAAMGYKLKLLWQPHQL